MGPPLKQTASNPALNLGDFAPWKVQPLDEGNGRCYPGQDGLRRLILDACGACPTLGVQEEAARRVFERLHSEWVVDVDHLRTLDSSGWARLKFPPNLVAAFRARLSGDSRRRPSSAPAMRGPRQTAAPLHAPRRTQSTPEGRWQQRPSKSSAASAAEVVPCGGGGGLAVAAVRPDAFGLAFLRGELLRLHGPQWPLVMLGALHRAVITISVLQNVFRAAGVASTPAQCSLVVRKAAAAGDGAHPDADAVVDVLHGPLQSWRLQAALAAFGALAQDYSQCKLRPAATADVTSLPVTFLRRRCDMLQHPAVRTGRLSAETALDRFFRPFRGLEVVSLEKFLAAHVNVSTWWPDDEQDFLPCLLRLWSIKQCQGDSTVLAERRRRCPWRSPEEPVWPSPPVTCDAEGWRRWAGDPAGGWSLEQVAAGAPSGDEESLRFEPGVRNDPERHRRRHTGDVERLNFARNSRGLKEKHFCEGPLPAQSRLCRGGVRRPPRVWCSGYAS